MVTETKEKIGKKELIDRVVASATDVNVTKAQVAKVIDLLFDNIKESLSKGEVISLVGFGNFSTKDRPARTGRNPRDW